MDTLTVRSILLHFALLFALSACNLRALPPGPEVAAATAVAQTLQSSVAATNEAAGHFPTATALALPTNNPGLPITNASLSIPPGLATGIRSDLVPESRGADVPVWDLHPAYTRITFEGYPLQGTALQPVINIYPADSFSQTSEAASLVINDLKSLLASQGTQSTSMPFLPLQNASQVFFSNTARLSFQNGVGFRYLTQFDQAPLPVNNHELLYTFQGLTQDGRYYVAALLPVNTGFLHVDANPQSPTPPDGIPFDWNDPQTMPAYLQSVKQRLEGASPEVFVPNLTSLDALIQSMKVDLP